MIAWSTAAPAVTAAFLASFVEFVEAFTILLAVGTVRGWRPAVWGGLAGLVLLVALVLAIGPLLGQVPLQPLQFVIGVLLLLFGMRWLRKAVLRAGGVLPLHDEEGAFAKELAELQGEERRKAPHLDWLAGIAAFKAVVLEGLEVAFTVVAVGAPHGLLVPASLGAGVAGISVVLIGFMIRRPLARVPENTLKFAVGVMLSAFGVFWTGEGLGIAWPGGDATIFAFVLLFLALGLAMAAFLRRSKVEVTP